MGYRLVMHQGLGPVILGLGLMVHPGRPVMMIVCVMMISARTGLMRLGPVDMRPVGSGMSAAGTVVGDMLAAASGAIVGDVLASAARAIVIRLLNRLSPGRPSASVSSAMAFALFGALLFQGLADEGAGARPGIPARQKNQSKGQDGEYQACFFSVFFLYVSHNVSPVFFLGQAVCMFYRFINSGSTRMPFKQRL